MADSHNRVAVDRVRWLEVLPVLRLGSAFRHALQPGKLVVALLAVLVLHGSGLLMDAVWFGDDEPGIYREIVEMQGDAFIGLAGAALSLDFNPDAMNSVPNILARMLVWIPAMAFDDAPWFTMIYGLIALFVITLSGGIICRMSATQVCSGKLTPLPRAIKFVSKRWAWYLLTPAIPAGFALLLGCVLMLAGLIFFNAPVLDVVGSLLYGLLLLVGFIIAFIGFVFVFAMLLMTPAMSVEGTDSFDAIARAFNYVIYKPWQFAGYLFGSVVYLAVVYMIVSALAGLTLSATEGFVGVGGAAWAPESTTLTTQEGIVLDKPTITRYEAITERGDIEGAGAMVESSSWIVRRWVELLVGLVIALMFSVVCSLQTQVYVLMRRASDNTPLDDCAKDDETDPWSSPADMVDPAAQAIAAAGPMGHPKPDTAGTTADTPDEPAASTDEDASDEPAKEE